MAVSAVRPVGPSAGPRRELVYVRPALLGDKDAALYLGRSASWIRKLRAADTQRGLRNQEPEGPAWVCIGPSIFYRLSDLDAWIDQHAVERGVVAFKNRGGLTEMP